MHSNLDILKNQYYNTMAQEKLFIDNKDAFIKKYSDELIDNKAIVVGYEHLTYGTSTVLSEVFNKNALNGRYPEMLKPCHNSVTMVYSPGCTIKETRKKATEYATSSYEGALVRKQVDVKNARAALEEALSNIKAQQAEIDRLNALQDEVASLLGVQ